MVYVAESIAMMIIYIENYVTLEHRLVTLVMGKLYDQKRKIFPKSFFLEFYTIVYITELNN